jgi:ABC-type lipoprotein release transport system permease subunit
MFQFLRIAARNLIKHRTRSLLIGGAIAAVTTLLVTLQALTGGIQGTILRNATALASGHVNIAGFYKISQSSANPMVTDFRPLLEMARKEIPEAKLFYDRLKSWGKVISDSTSIMAPVWGVDFENEREVIGHLPLANKSAYLEGYQPKAGEAETEGTLEDLKSRGNLVIFATHAKKLKVRVGDSVTLSMPTYRNVYNTKDVRVAAVLADMGLMSSFSLFLHHDDIRDIYQVPKDATGHIMIFLKDPKDMAMVEERLRKLIKARGLELMEKEAQPYWMKFDRVSGESWTGQKIDITTWQDETSYIKWVLDILKTMTFVATTVLMTIVVLGLVNTLWMSIRERTTEIGTLRAIGLQRSQVLVLFLLEALLLSTASIAAGILAGTGFCAFLNALEIPISESFQMFLMANSLHLSINAADLVFSFVLLTLFLTLGSLLPSYRASRMKPITAINTVN